MGVALIKLMADITDTAGVVWNNSTRHLDGVPTVFIDGVSQSVSLMFVESRVHLLHLTVLVTWNHNCSTL